MLGAAVESRDPMIRRLFPPAYPGDDAGRRRERVPEPGRRGPRSTITARPSACSSETPNADTLDEPSSHAWLSAVGSMRLVLGTRLDVTEDMDTALTGGPVGGRVRALRALGQLQSTRWSRSLPRILPDEGSPRPEGPVIASAILH